MGKVAKQKQNKADPEPPLPENRLDDTTVKKATAALVKYLQKAGDDSDKKQLFSKAETVTLQFTLQKLPEPKHKPYLIPLKHTLYNPEDGVELCLFTKDPAEPVKDKLESKPVPGFTEVIGYTKLRKDYKQFQAKRELLHRYDAFFADERIYPMLPRLLGKVFYGRKKQPYPVKIDTPHMGQQLAKARDCTAVFPGFGTCMAVRIGWSNFTAKQLHENIMHSIRRIVSKIPKGWNNIQSIYLKSASSTSLPVFAQTPASLLPSGEGQANGTTKSEKSEEEDSEGSDEDDDAGGKVDFSDEDDTDDEEEDDDDDDTKGSRIPTIGSRTMQTTASTSQRTPAKKRQVPEKTTPTTSTKKQKNATVEEEAQETPKASTAQTKRSKTTATPKKAHSGTPEQSIKQQSAKTPASSRAKKNKVQIAEPEQEEEETTEASTSKTPAKTPAKSTKKQQQTPKTEGKATRKTAAANGGGKTPQTASKAATTRKYSPRRTRSSTATPKK